MKLSVLITDQGPKQKRGSEKEEMCQLGEGARIQGAHAASVTPRGLHPELVLSSDIALAGGCQNWGRVPQGSPWGFSLIISYQDGLGMRGTFVA